VPQNGTQFKKSGIMNFNAWRLLSDETSNFELEKAKDLFLFGDVGRICRRYNTLLQLMANLALNLLD